MTSAGQASWSKMLDVLGPGARKADVYGVTTSSYLVSMTV
jgi:hypothetical protein